MIKKLVEGITDIRTNEVKATVLSFLFVFTLMLAYYILRPVRDAMASDWSDAEVSQLWTLNFFISTGLVALYGGIVSKIRFSRIVPGVYVFFAISFVLFFMSMKSTNDVVLIEKSFYVWISVFAMFHLSVFWSFMSDIFTKDQAKRLFATIAAGASAGALLGPMIPTLFVEYIGVYTLILIAATLLFVPIPLIIILAKLKYTALENASQDSETKDFSIGGNPLNGFKSFFSNPYLLAIGAFILLYTMISTFVYFEQKNLLAAYDRTSRTQILGGIDWIVNLLTFGVAFFATSKLVKTMGMGVTLASIPLLVGAGILILAFAPVIVVLLALQVCRKAGNYAVTKPAREMLFTEVSKEDRFKAKPVIDVVVYRGGDTITAWLFTGLTEGLGLGLSAIGVIGAAIAAIWAALGFNLGKRYNKIQND